MVPSSALANPQFGPLTTFTSALAPRLGPFPLPAWQEAEVPKHGWYLLAEAVSVPHPTPCVPPVPGPVATGVTSLAVLTWVPSLNPL